METTKDNHIRKLSDYKEKWKIKIEKFKDTKKIFKIWKKKCMKIMNY